MRARWIASLLSLMLGLAAVITWLIIMPKSDLTYPSAPADVTLEASRRLEEGERLCAVIDLESLWREGNSLGFPIAFGADIKPGKPIELEITGNALNSDGKALPEPILLIGALDDDNWTKTIKETVGPNDFCTKLLQENSARGSDVRDFVFDFFFTPSPEHPGLDWSNDDGLIVSVLKADRSQFAKTDETGTLSLKSPQLSLVGESAVPINRGGTGFTMAIGDSAGYSVVENEPYPVNPDVWKSGESDLEIEWRGETIKAGRDRSTKEGIAWAFLGAAVPFFLAAIGEWMMIIREKHRGNPAVVLSVKQAIPTGFKFEIRENATLLVASPVYDTRGEAELAAKRFRQNMDKGIPSGYK